MNVHGGRSTGTLNTENITNQFIGHCKNFHFPLGNKVWNELASRFIIYDKLRHRHCRVPSVFSLIGNNNSSPAVWLYYRPGISQPLIAKETNWLLKLFSELGGAAGLVLGISLITIVRQVDATITWLIRHFKLKLGYGKSRVHILTSMSRPRIKEGSIHVIISSL